MRQSLLFATLLFTAFARVGATTWQVGPSRTYKAPSAVAGLVKDGDTVAIDAGTYESDVARWSASNLVLRGVGGYAHMKANGASFGGKAIWVIAGNNTTVESIEFSLCTVVDHNGAGIREEGTSLTVRGCFFHDNQDGILAGDNAASDIVIEHCEFVGNGFGDGLSHNLYINHVRSLTFRYNYSHRASIGHELKSRAYTNYILFNRLANEATGTGSREIDLPNGGTAYIIGNEIQQGPQGENSNIVGYGLEGLTNPTPHEVYLVNNTIVNQKGAGSFLNVQNGTALVKAYNNIFAGPGSLIAGSATAIDSMGNIAASVGSIGFVDAATYDYHLLVASPAIDAGTDPGAAGAYTLAPPYEYRHPTDAIARSVTGRIDAGAHEIGIVLGVKAVGPAAKITITAYPNPATTSATIAVSGIEGRGRLALYDMLGREVWEEMMESDGRLSIPTGALPAGVYHCRLTDGSRSLASTTIVVR
jgi:hypothetical protein